MATNNDLVIQAPRQGVAQSPHVGFGSCVNLDIDSIPGIVQLNKITAKVSGSTVTQLVNWIVRNPLAVLATELYAVDTAGTVYKSDGDSFTVLSFFSSSSAHGNGLAIWKDYLFVARDAALDTYGPLSGQVFTVTIASPAVFTTSAAHGLAADDPIIFSTSDTLPTGLTVGTTYYVIAAGLTATDFRVSTTVGGGAVNTSGSQAGTHKYISAKTGANTFQSITTDTLWHPLLTSKNDNKLYGGAGKYVFSLDENVAPFTPGVAGSYTWAPTALDLPSSYRIKCLEELGTYLMAGTWQGTLVTEFPIADIFPWDRSSTSFGQPIQLNDFGIHAMKNTGSSLVVLAGVTGAIYRSDGVSAVQIGQLPDILLTSGRFNEWSPGAITIWKNKVYIGTGVNAATTAKQGIYSLKQTPQGNVLNLESLNSTLTDGSAAAVRVGALLVFGRNTLFFSWQSNTTYGVDVTNASSFLYTTDYSGYFDSPLYVVGTNQNKRTFKQIEFTLAKKLATGEGIKVEYRTNLTDSFTAVKTRDGGTLNLNFTTLGAVISQWVHADIPACELLQIRVSLLGTETTTPQFKSLTLR